MILYTLFSNFYSMWFIPIIIALQKKLEKKMKNLFLLDCDWPTYHVFSTFLCIMGKKKK